MDRSNPSPSQVIEPEGAAQGLSESPLGKPVSSGFVSGSMIL
jgi:hypothetical protein